MCSLRFEWYDRRARGEGGGGLGPRMCVAERFGPGWDAMCVPFNVQSVLCVGRERETYCSKEGSDAGAVVLGCARVWGV